MDSRKSVNKQSLMYLVKKRLSKKTKNTVPEDLQQAINNCSTIEQLLDLLFSTEFLENEATIDAFDNRIDELLTDYFLQHIK